MAATGKIIFFVPPGVHMLDMSGPTQAFLAAGQLLSGYPIEYCSFCEAIEDSTGLHLGRLRLYGQVEATVGDTIFLPGFSSRLLRAYPEREEWEGVYGWLREKADAGVRICSVCTGAFILARAGLLDGRACTTHWSMVPLLRQLFPAIDVREDTLYIQDGNIYTSAGISSGIDLALHLLEVAHGPLLAHKVARELVVYIRRGDRHSQESVYLNFRNHLHRGVHQLQDWLIDHLDRKLTIDEMAEMVNMSARNLTRTFKLQTGISVNRYITLLRIEMAATLRNSPGITMREIAGRCGFANERQLQRILKGAAASILIGMILLSGFACYAQGGHAPAPTGRLIDAGGHLLHLHVMGKGRPVVVFEGGSGDFSFIWDLVQPEVSKNTMTVSYDRAGYAWSQDGPSPRTGRQISYELNKALHNAGIDGPYILVGQSFGGFLVRYFARYYPGEVAGMVLVDALNEDSRIIINNQPFRIRDWAKGRQAPAPRDTTVSHPNSASEMVPDTTLEFPLNKLSVSDQKMQIWAQSQPAHRLAGNSEMDWSPEDVADLYAKKGKPGYVLGDMPLIVLSRGSGGYQGLPDSAALENERLNLQEELTRLSTNSKHIIVSNSGHNIHLEQPGVVIDAILQVIDACQAHSKLEQ